MIFYTVVHRFESGNSHLHQEQYLKILLNVCSRLRSVTLISFWFVESLQVQKYLRMIKTIYGCKSKVC